MAGYNGGLSDAQIREMQQYYGTTVDGAWGPKSAAAAGGGTPLSAQQAWKQYQQQKSSGGGYSGGSVSSGGSSYGGSSYGGSSYGGSSYNNGGLTTQQVAEMQKYYGANPDGLWGQNSTAAAGGLSAQQAWQQYQQQKGQDTTQGVMGFEDFYNSMGGASYEQMVRNSINASVQQAVDAFEAQKADTEKDAAEMARQAYIAKMLGQKNLGQQLAAGGYAGGMAESAMLEQEVNYQNNLNEIERQKQRTLEELQRAIDNARLTGDMEAAEMLAAFMKTVQGDYSGYYDTALAQMQQAQAATSSGSGTGYTGAYVNNEGVPANTVKLLQQQINSTLPAGQQIAVDGVWGPATTAAAGGMSASQYLDAYESYMNRYASQGGR